MTHRHIMTKNYMTYDIKFSHIMAALDDTAFHCINYLGYEYCDISIFCKWCALNRIYGQGSTLVDRSTSTVQNTVSNQRFCT